MKNNYSLEQIRSDLSVLKNHWLIIYGSWLREDYIPNRSDVDIAVLSKSRDRSHNLSLWSKSLGNFSSKWFRFNFLDKK